MSGGLPIANFSRWLASLLCAACLAAPPARAGKIPLEEPPPAAPQASSPVGKLHKVLLYLPDRVFDLLDVVRMQVRAGPGWALGARITRSAPLFVGDYTASWVGLPGPRGRPTLPLPFGVATQSGFALGPATSFDGGQGPAYGRGELGAVAHVYMLGFDVGFDFFELADFFAGFAGVDLAHDDY
ncbi:MAG TPA: hypothetical protein VMR31_08890 [Myxococcota bacterium]|nr:hypothetical protein [Myxococcota bacterium]